MEFYLIAFCLGITGYLIGSFPTGVVFTRRKFGLDVREMGSGNIGATNVTRVFGWYAGILVFVIDLFKGAGPLWLVKTLWPNEPWLLTATGSTLVMGHCFSAYLKFKGGKGVATSLGCLFIVAPWVAICSAIIYVALLVITRISAVGSLGGLGAVLIYLFIARPALSESVLLLVISFVVLIRHRSNIERLYRDFQNWQKRK